MLQNAQEMAPAAWWDLYGKHLPILTGVAKSVLAQVVCASAAERSNLSIYGQIKHKGRSQLSHAKSARKARLHQRGAAPAQQAAEGGLQRTRPRWRSGTPTPSLDDSGDEEDLMV